MTTVTELANAALSHCGTRSKISDINEGSPEANACLTHYGMVRDTSLRTYDWNFARLTVALAQLSIPIPAGKTVAPTSNVQRWSYEFVLPADCVRVRMLNDVPILVTPQQWYEMAADKDSLGNPISVVFCNVSSVSAIYTAQIVDPSRWDAGFADAVVYGLAGRICYELTGKSDRVKELTQMWQHTLQEAAAQMLNENPDPSPTYVPEMLQARGYDDGQARTGQAYPAFNSWPEKPSN